MNLTEILAQFDEPEWKISAMLQCSDTYLACEHNRTVRRMRALRDALAEASSVLDSMPRSFGVSTESQVIAAKLTEALK